MKLRRIQNPHGWTSIPNAALEDTRLSWRASGLLAYLLSRPEGWETDSIRLASSRPGKEGRDAVRTALADIEAAGYLHRVTVRRRGGQLVTEWFVSDHPVDHPSEVLELGDGVYVDDPHADAWESGPGANSVDNPVDESGITPPPTPEKPTPENPAALTSTSTQGERELGGDPTTLAPLAVESVAGLMAGAAPPGGLTAAEADGAAGPDLPQTDAVALVSRLETRVQVFALRAHLVAVLGSQPSLVDVAGWVEAAHESALPDRRGRLTTADVVAYVTDVTSAPPPGDSVAVPASRPASIDGDASPIPSPTPRPAKGA